MIWPCICWKWLMWLCVGGASFGAPECIRMSYATSDENIVEAIRRIKEALANLK